MATLGLTMIVKNEAHTLRACLQSVRSLVSQIVIADTGSTDGTAEIAREFGATVVDFPWDNHFANARNAALKPLTTDWALMLDADEELDSGASDLLPGLLAAEGVGGYLTPIRNYIPTRFGRTWDRLAVENDGRHPRASNAPGFVVHENCRLFRRHPEIYFVGRVHELVEHRIRALGLKLPIAGLCIHHFGRLGDEGKRQQKAAFYRDLLRIKVKENPRDPVALMEFGLQEIEFFQNPEEALRCFRRALEVDPRISQAWLFTGMAELQLGHPKEALAALKRANRQGVGASLREHWMGDALLQLGQPHEALPCYRRALKLTGDDHILESKLGFLEVQLQLGSQGLKRLRRAAEAMPRNFEIRDALIKAYLLSDQLSQAAQELAEYAELVPHPKLFFRAASIYARLKDWGKAGDVLARGLQRFPDSGELLQAQTEVLRRSSQTEPKDPISPHTTGAVPTANVLVENKAR